MQVLAEFKGGHRYFGGTGLDKRELTAEQWDAILKHSTPGYHSTIPGSMWRVTGKKSQCKGTNDMSIGGFIKFLEAEGIKVDKSITPKKSYNVYTIYPTAEFKSKIRAVSIDKNYAKGYF